MALWQIPSLPHAFAVRHFLNPPCFLSQLSIEPMYDRTKGFLLPLSNV